MPMTDAELQAARAQAARVHATGDTALVGSECRDVAQLALSLLDEVARMRAVYEAARRWYVNSEDAQDQQAFDAMTAAIANSFAKGPYR